MQRLKESAWAVLNALSTFLLYFVFEVRERPGEKSRMKLGYRCAPVTVPLPKVPKTLLLKGLQTADSRQWHFGT
jgi:hypothetical protein